MIDPLDRELIHEDSLARIYWDRKGKYIDMEAKASSTVGQYRNSITKILELVKQKRAGNILANVAQLERISDEDLVWTEVEWVPDLVKAGVKRIAVVPPKQMAAYLDIEKLVTDTSKDVGGFERRFFSNPDEARKWLSQH